METETTPKPQRKIEYRPPTDGLPHVYTNNVQIASTGYDIRIIFGEVGDVTDDKVIVEQRVQVAMSWIQAKSVADFLRVNIEAYEKLNGPITLPKNLDKIIVPETFPPLK
jgi:hypothetical protein